MTIPKSTLTPREIVKELDRHIIGQDAAKRSVAIALRNRWRRQQVPEGLREEIVPKNILMIGPTGVGKTEIARRLAKLADAPFIKVEATKFTEVGYVGRDVDSIIRDLLEIAILQMKEVVKTEQAGKAELSARKRIIDALVGENSSEETKKKFEERLDAGELEDKEIEIHVQDNPNPHTPLMDIPGMPGGQMGILNITDIFGKLGGHRTKLRKMTVTEAKKVVLEEEIEKLTDNDSVIQNAISQVENNGIVFLDEIDKIASRYERGGEVSREGVQRDLLPLIEGTIVPTKHGNVKTDHVLFITSGAFHVAKPSDLLPELQGRLPIRVELKPLSQDDMVRILTEPEASLIKQYIALMATEGVSIDFDQAAIIEIARLSTEINANVENIGARRLHTIIEKLMEEISFEASDLKVKKIKIDSAYVTDKMKDITKQTDVTKFIL